MMITEFTALTGFEPSMEEYAEIEEQYYEFDGDKKAFCRKFVEVMEEYETADGLELGGMPEADALKLADEMKSYIWEAVNEIKKAMGISLVRAE